MKKRPLGLKKLAKDLAVRARSIKSLLSEQCYEGSEIYASYTTFKEAAFRKIELEEFIDATAQLIVYRLFITRLHGPLTDADASDCVPYTLPTVLRAEITHLSEVLNSFEVTSEILEGEPCLYFYEDFLKEYSDSSKKSLGVFYTPKPIVEFIIRGVEDILRDEFSIEDGFASDRITALDFATGTGTFLVEMFRTALDKLPPSQPPSVVFNNFLKNFYGFEYMMAPLVIARFKVSQLLKQYGCEATAEEDLRIYLADTLMSWESGALEKISNDKPISIIVGNPPYSVFSKNCGNSITSFMRDYKFVDGAPLAEKNMVAINDDYVKFIRFAQWKMDQVEEGIVGIICNNGFLDNITFRGMRASLLKTFNKIYIIDLHGNSKKGEISPDGSQDENVFDIRAGVCIAFFVKSKSSESRVYHTDLWGRRASKLAELSQLRIVE